MTNGKVLLFNPRSANSKHRLPNSILQVGASIYGRHEFVFVDGNLERDPFPAIQKYLESGEFGYFACTVMPGPQLRQAIPFSKKIRASFPDVCVIWGGYFASNQYKVVMESGFVDFVIYGPGDNAFPALLHALGNGNAFQIHPQPRLENAGRRHIIKRERKPARPGRAAATPLRLPRPVLSAAAPESTFSGQKTLAYLTSMGCPFKCSFAPSCPLRSRWRVTNPPSISTTRRQIRAGKMGRRQHRISR